MHQNQSFSKLVMPEKKWFEQMFCNSYMNLLNEEAVASIPNKSLQNTKFSVNICGASPSSSFFKEKSLP